MSERLPTIIDIPVSGGIGTKIQNMGGNGIAVGIKPPSGFPTYDVEITDNDGFGVWGIVGAQGIMTGQCWIQMYGLTTIAITNATSDGLYRAKVWYDQSN